MVAGFDFGVLVAQHEVVSAGLALVAQQPSAMAGLEQQQRSVCRVSAEQQHCDATLDLTPAAEAVGVSPRKSSGNPRFVTK